MAWWTRGQINHMEWVMVDATDFATVESAIATTAIRIRIWGTLNGNSAAPSLILSGIGSLAAAGREIDMVRSGVYHVAIGSAQMSDTQQAFYDNYIFWASATGAALQVIPVQGRWYDDSDIYSLVSNVDSALTSQFNVVSNYLSNASNYLSNISALISDVDSALASQSSDIRSQISNTDSRISALVSDVQSIVAGNSNVLSNMSNIVSNINRVASQIHEATIVRRGTALSGTASMIRLDAGAPGTNDLYNENFVVLVGGTGAGQARVIEDYVVSTTARRATVRPNWVTNPDGTTVFIVVPDAGVMEVLSNLSDIDSALTSQFNAVSNYLSNASNYLSNISALVSDVSSQVLLNASLASDAASAAQQANSRALVIQSLVSDVDSALTSRFSNLESLLTTTGVQLNASTMSDLRSAINAGPAATVTASDISDIASAVWAARFITHSGGSGFGSLVRLMASRVSDLGSELSDFRSDLNSLLTVTGVQLNASTMSDLRSAITAGPAGAVTVSDISDIASAVWAARYTAHSGASSFGSLMSDIFSRIVLIQSTNSDIDSALTSQFNYLSNAISDMHSDLQSRIAGITATVSVSDISDIASRVQQVLASDLSDILSAAQAGASRALLNQSRISDVYSLLSDAHSDLRSYLVGISGSLSDVYSLLSDANSDLRSQIQETLIVRRATAQAGAAGTITLDAGAPTTDNLYRGFTIALVGGTGVGQAREIAAYNGTTKVATVIPNWVTNPDVTTVFIVLNQVGSKSYLSDLTSDLRSFLVGMSGVLSDTYSLLSDLQSDFGSRVPKRVATDSQLSDVHSDLQSRIAGITATLSVSDISDIASRVQQVLASDISDILSSTRAGASRALLTQSQASDIYSLLSDAHSDLRSYLVGISGTLSDVYSLTSDLQSDFGSRVPKRVATDSQLSNLHSDLSARLPTTLSSGRMRADLEAVAGNTEAASDLSFSARTIVRGAAVAGTLSTTQMTTDLTEVTDSHYNGRVIIWTSGALRDQATDITAYLGSTKRLTYTAVTEAPVAGDTFVIV